MESISVKWENIQQQFKRSEIIQRMEGKPKGKIWIVELLLFFLVFGILAFAADVASYTLGYIIFAIEEQYPLFEVNEFLLIAVMYLPALFMPIVAIIWYKVIQKRTWTEIGFKKGNILREYGFGALAGTVLITAIIIIGWLTTFFQNLRLSEYNSFIGIIMMLGFWIVQGMAEEIVFRGCLFLSICRRNNPVLAAILSSLAFSLYHFLNPGYNLTVFFGLFLFGLFSCSLMVKRNNIWICGAFHTFWNFVQNDIFGFHCEGMQPYVSILTVDQHQSSILGGGYYGLEGSILVSIILIAAIVVLFTSESPKEPDSKIIKDEETPQANETQGEAGEDDNHMEISEMISDPDANQEFNIEQE